MPDNVDVLITHGPPHGILDFVNGGCRVGCEELLKKVKRIRPRVHVFGHIHEGAGLHEEDGTTFINASVVDEHYRVVHSVQTMILSTTPAATDTP